jgi:hypothetical protein
MQRRIALAIALAFTIVTSFSVITVGARTGLFGDDASGEEPPKAVVPAASPAVPTAAAQVAPYVPEPIVVTEYVYVDEPAPVAPSSGGQTQALAADSATSAAAGATSVPDQPAPVDPTVAPPPPTAAPPTAAPPSQSHEDDDDEDERESEDEHEEEDEDEHEEVHEDDEDDD